MYREKPLVIGLDEITLPMSDRDRTDFRFESHGYGLGPDDLHRILEEQKPIALLFRSQTDLREDVFRRLQSVIKQSGLRMLLRLGVGMDRVYRKGFESEGVEVLNAPTANRESTADLTMRCLQSGAGLARPKKFSLQEGARRQIDAVPMNVAKLRWSNRIFDSVYGEESNLAGRKIGVICCGGEIGGRVTGRLVKAGAEVYGWNRTREKIRHNHAITVVDEIPDLVDACDMVTLHASMDDGSAEGLVGREFFERMKEKPLRCFVNTARAQATDEAALFEAVRNGYLHNAQLDVVSIEGAALLGHGQAFERLSGDQRRHLYDVVLPLIRHPNVSYLFHSAGEQDTTKIRNELDALRKVRELVCRL